MVTVNVFIIKIITKKLWLMMMMCYSLQESKDNISLCGRKQF